MNLPHGTFFFAPRSKSICGSIEGKITVLGIQGKPPKGPNRIMMPDAFSMGERTPKEQKWFGFNLVLQVEEGWRLTYFESSSTSAPLCILVCAMKRSDGKSLKALHVMAAVRRIVQRRRQVLCHLMKLPYGQMGSQQLKITLPGYLGTSKIGRFASNTFRCWWPYQYE